jgi:hypothetical protein
MAAPIHDTRAVVRKSALQPRPIRRSTQSLQIVELQAGRAQRGGLCAPGPCARATLCVQGDSAHATYERIAAHDRHSRDAAVAGCSAVPKSAVSGTPQCHLTQPPAQA